MSQLNLRGMPSSFGFDSVDLPAVTVPHRIFDKICDAAVAAFRMLLDKHLDCLKHLRR